MNYKNLFRDGLIILSILIALIPITNRIYELMNASSDLAYFGPIIWFGVMSLSYWVIIERVKSISNNFKQNKEWQQNIMESTEKKATVKSDKNKKNKNKSINN